MATWRFTCGKRKRRTNNFQKLKSWTGSCSCAFPSITSTVVRFCIGILNLRTFSWPRAIRLSWAISVFRRCLRARKTMQWRCRVHHTTCRQKCARINLTPTNRISGLWVASCMSSAPLNTPFTQKICLDSFSRLCRINKSQYPTLIVREWKTWLICFWSKMKKRDQESLRSSSSHSWRSTWQGLSPVRARIILTHSLAKRGKSNKPLKWISSSNRISTH